MLVKRSLFAFVLLLFISSTIAQKQAVIVSETATTHAFPLSSEGVQPVIHYDSADATVVHIAANMFANDVEAVTGRYFPLSVQRKISATYAVVVGTTAQSSIIHDLIKRKLISIDSLNNQWERFSIQVVDHPYPSTQKLLVIVGSDRRGAAYGLMHLSRLIGVSPFTWWADIPAKHHRQLFIEGSYISSTPSVQYRGIFLNDEDWGLRPWAANGLDAAVKDIGPNTYQKIFELMLRLKANYIWPAMHPGTKAFYYYKANPKLADDYAILVGGSHCEPMLRNNVFEWSENFEHEYGRNPGVWRYDVNGKEIYQYWNDRVKESEHYESIYTIGMRGIHDGSMPGPKDPNEKKKLLEKVIEDQRTILQNDLHKDVATVPQIFVPYKEVLSLYQRGMHVPEDVTIIWPDDNYGYIRQFPNEAEQKRSGGNGVYYHLSYWGRPQDYLWLSSISPALISYELCRAYAFDAKKLWVFNVGDLKPAEEELQFAMDLAWDVNSWQPQQAHEYSRQWAKEVFGDAFADKIATIKNEYYHLAASGKPEHLNKLSFTTDEWKERIQAYQTIAHKAAALNSKLPVALQDAYYQLVLYPVESACLMNEKFGYAHASITMAQQGNASALEYAGKSKAAYDSIILLTQKYNTGIANGKWKGMMSWQPRGLDVFKMPAVADAALVEKDKGDSIKAVTKDTVLVNSLSITGFTKKADANETITLLKGLGETDTVLTVMPFTYGAAQGANGTIPIANYVVSLQPGKYLLQLHAVPTHALYKKTSLPVKVTIVNDQPVVLNIDVAAETPEWDKNVINGYVERTVPFSVANNEPVSISIQFVSTGVLISKLSILSIK